MEGEIRAQILPLPRHCRQRTSDGSLEECSPSVPPLRVGRRMNCLAHLLISAAAADIRDLAIDVLVGRFWLILEQSRDRHDHAALQIAALRHVILDPSLLYFMQLPVLARPSIALDLL